MDAIVLDFFAGSGTTAQAVMSQNAGDGGLRSFIMVQMCEDLRQDSLQDYSNLAELSRERIRRAGKKIKEEAGLTVADLDVGFRTLRVDSTNMANVLRTPDAVEQGQLDAFTDSVKPGRTGEDLLFQVLLDWGLTLDLPIEREIIDGREVFTVDGGALIACFDADVSLDAVRAIAKREPLRAVFRDSGFASDAERINAEQIFAEVSPSTDVKAI